MTGWRPLSAWKDKDDIGKSGNGEMGRGFVPDTRSREGQRKETMMMMMMTVTLGGETGRRMRKEEEGKIYF